MKCSKKHSSKKRDREKGAREIDESLKKQIKFKRLCKKNVFATLMQRHPSALSGIEFGKENSIGKCCQTFPTSKTCATKGIMKCQNYS